jgi:hypothetical protein
MPLECSIKLAKLKKKETHPLHQPPNNLKCGLYGEGEGEGEGEG